MSLQAEVTTRTVEPAHLPPRWVRLVRSCVLLATGLVVTFSASLHEQLTFDLIVVAIALALIAAVHFVEGAQRRASGGASTANLLGVASLLAAAFVAGLAIALRNTGTISGDVAGQAYAADLQAIFPVVVAGWALVSALLEFVGGTVLPGSRQDGTIIGAAGILLAITVLLARTDIVAVVGFFGAYAVVAGVFLGIAAFDSRANAETEDSTHRTAVSV